MLRDKKTTYAEEREYKRFPFTLSTLTEAETEDKVIKVKRGQKGVNQEACHVTRLKNLFRELKKFCLACKAR